jgi:hypothetical protein
MNPELLFLLWLELRSKEHFTTEDAAWSVYAENRLKSEGYQIFLDPQTCQYDYRKIEHD